MTGPPSLEWDEPAVSNAPSRVQAQSAAEADPRKEMLMQNLYVFQRDTPHQQYRMLRDEGGELYKIWREQGGSALVGQPKFLKWLRSKDSRVLIVHGKGQTGAQEVDVPGYQKNGSDGKVRITTLSWFTAEFRQSLGDEHKATILTYVAGFYYHEKSKLHGARGMIRMLCYQLLTMNDAGNLGLDFLDKLSSEKRKPYEHSMTRTDMQRLCNLFEHLVLAVKKSKTGKSIICIIEGIDVLEQIRFEENQSFLDKPLREEYKQAMATFRFLIEAGRSNARPWSFKLLIIHPTWTSHQTQKLLGKDNTDIMDLSDPDGAVQDLTRALHIASTVPENTVEPVKASPLKEAAKKVRRNSKVNCAIM